MEFCQFGTLTSIIFKEKLSSKFKIKCALDAAKGMKVSIAFALLFFHLYRQFLHENNILHRDFKPDNLLVVSKNPDSAVCVKLTDFGTRLTNNEINFFFTSF